MSARLRALLLATLFAASISAASSTALMTDCARLTGGVSVTSRDWTITPYLTFSSPGAFTLATANASKNWDGRLDYSTDTVHWSEWLGSEIGSGANNKLFLRGRNNTTLNASMNETSRFVLTGSEISCDGNAETLLDYDTTWRRGHPVMADCAFEFLFYGCSALIAPPRLEATALSGACYYSMFQDSSIRTAPELPATVLAQGCYAYMFSGCGALTAAPELPATTLAQGCYNCMFCDCTALITGPSVLRSENGVPVSSMLKMFFGCAALTSAPTSISADTVEDYGCYAMFQGCASLTTPPALPATTLGDYAYRAMFLGCTQLSAVPELPATMLPDMCYASMFYGTGIRLALSSGGEYQTAYRIPASGTASSVADTALSEMFAYAGAGAVVTPAADTIYWLSASNTIVPAA